jgi:NAD-dependent dihydropyrimidine dehydrogenase PreA subunit
MKQAEIPIQTYAEKCTGCLSCQLRCSLTYLDSFNPLGAYIQVRRRDGTQITFTEECNACGFCVEECRFGALKLG